MAKRTVDRLLKWIRRAPAPEAGPSAIPQVGAREMAEFDPNALALQVPVLLTNEQRVELATRCRDADPLPKVVNAGAIERLEDGREVQVMFNGLRVVAGSYYGDWMQTLIARCQGHHEPQEEVAFDRILQHLPEQARMIEIGGYWSFYTIWFLSRAAGREAIVLEPDPAYLAQGQANAALGGVAPVFVNAYAGGARQEPRPFPTESSGEVVIPCRAVPELMEEAGWDRLDLLHCDAQGVEFEILSSCADLFRDGRIGWIVVSTHAHQISGDPLTHQRCLALILGLGGKVVAEHDVHESFSGDGLIVARFGPLPEGWVDPEISYNRYSESLFRNPIYDLATKG